MASPASAPTQATAVSTDEYGRRFGALLRRHRRKQSVGLRRLAARTAHSLSVTDLRAYERGRRSLDADTLHRLCAVYGIPVQSVLPDHHPVVIDMEDRQMHVGGTTVDLPDSDDPSPYLQRYVRTVNRLRSRPMKNPATLRRPDTEALAEAFELSVDEVTDLISDLIGRNLAARRRTLGLRSGGGTLAAVIVVGAAATALPPRSSEADTAVLSSNELTDDGEHDEEGDAPGAAQDVPPDIETLPDISTYHGPHPERLQATAPPPEPDEKEADGEEAQVVEDETNVDAPGGPVVIEREDPDEGPAEIEDETEIGEGVTIERDDVENPNGDR